MSMRPAPIGSGSSVTSGRCCAAAGRRSATATQHDDSDESHQRPRSSDAEDVQLRYAGHRHRSDGRHAVRPQRLVDGRQRRRPSTASRAQLGRRVEPRVEQMPRRDVAERLQHRLLDAGMLDLELHQQPLGALPLQAEIAARRTAAADDRQLALLRVRPRFVFADVDERPDHHVRAVVGHELGRHRLQRAGEEQIQQQRLDEVVGVMAERDLRRADLLRDRGTARRGAAARTASTASGRRRGCLRSARRCRCARSGTPSRAPRRCCAMRSCLYSL